MEKDFSEEGVTFTANSPYAKLVSVPIRRVRMKNGFWKPRMEANSRRAIPKMLSLLKEHGVLDNFLIASGKIEGERRGLRFTDSDLYKWMEAFAFDLETNTESANRDTLKEIIAIVSDAQEENGYLNTYFIGEKKSERFLHLEWSHEFYCAGHLIQAALAHYRATGSSKLLEVARRFADYLVATFGPGKRRGFSGHPELEMALVELYRTTQDQRYLNFTGYLLEQLGFQSLTEIKGHAVRATYMTSGAADYYAETGDAEVLGVLEILWQDMVRGKIYITGGVGSRYAGEAFGEPFELPNLRAYSETCAAIGNFFWNWRMLTIIGETRFADLMERILYNAFLAGVSLDGVRYFYVNPLASLGNHTRQEWYECTCCPPNVQRMLASLPAYFYSVSHNSVWVHLYDNCQANLQLQDERRISIMQKTKYPWNGSIDITVSPKPESLFNLFLRIPSWTPKASVCVNDEELPNPEPGKYFRIEREWTEGDRVHLKMDMPTVLYDSDPHVWENRGRVAVLHGPLVYCFESVDNPDVPLFDFELIIDRERPERSFTLEFRPDLLGGITVLKGKGLAPYPGQPKDPLYCPLGKRQRLSMREIEVLAIPYYAWANRDPSQMIVWVPYVFS